MSVLSADRRSLKTVHRRLLKILEVEYCELCGREEGSFEVCEYCGKRVCRLCLVDKKLCYVCAWMWKVSECSSM